MSPKKRGQRSTKYIFVTGGVVSSLGKGLVSAALGALMENRGEGSQVHADLKRDPRLCQAEELLKDHEVSRTADRQKLGKTLNHSQQYRVQCSQLWRRKAKILKQHPRSKIDRTHDAAQGHEDLVFKSQ